MWFTCLLSPVQVVTTFFALLVVFLLHLVCYTSCTILHNEYTIYIATQLRVELKTFWLQVQRFNVMPPSHLPEVEHGLCGTLIRDLWLVTCWPWLCLSVAQTWTNVRHWKASVSTVVVVTRREASSVSVSRDTTTTLNAWSATVCTLCSIKKRHSCCYLH